MSRELSVEELLRTAAPSQKDEAEERLRPIQRAAQASQVVYYAAEKYTKNALLYKAAEENFALIAVDGLVAILQDLLTPSTMYLAIAGTIQEVDIIFDLLYVGKYVDELRWASLERLILVFYRNYSLSETKLIVCGHSLGGYEAMCFACVHELEFYTFNSPTVVYDWDVEETAKMNVKRVKRSEAIRKAFVRLSDDSSEDEEEDDANAQNLDTLNLSNAQFYELLKKGGTAFKDIYAAVAGRVGGGESSDEVIQRRRIPFVVVREIGDLVSDNRTFADAEKVVEEVRRSYRDISRHNLLSYVRGLNLSPTAKCLVSMTLGARFVDFVINTSVSVRESEKWLVASINIDATASDHALGYPAVRGLGKTVVVPIVVAKGLSFAMEIGTAAMSLYELVSATPSLWQWLTLLPGVGRQFLKMLSYLHSKFSGDQKEYLEALAQHSVDRLVGDLKFGYNFSPEFTTLTGERKRTNCKSQTLWRIGQILPEKEYLLRPDPSPLPMFAATLMGVNPGKTLFEVFRPLTITPEDVAEPSPQTPKMRTMMFPAPKQKDFTPLKVSPASYSQPFVETLNENRAKVGAQPLSKGQLEKELDELAEEEERKESERRRLEIIGQHRPQQRLYESIVGPSQTPSSNTLRSAFGLPPPPANETEERANEQWEADQRAAEVERDREEQRQKVVGQWVVSPELQQIEEQQARRLNRRYRRLKNVTSPRQASSKKDDNAPNQLGPLEEEWF